MTEVLTGKPFILRDGRALVNWVRPQHFTGRIRAPPMGFERDRRTLVIVAEDGTQARCRRAHGVPVGVGVPRIRCGGCRQPRRRRIDRTRDERSSRQSTIDGPEADRRLASRIRIRTGDVWQAGETLGGGGPSNVTEGAECIVVARSAQSRARDVAFVRDGGPSPTLHLDDGVIGYVASVRDSTPSGAIGANSRFAGSRAAPGCGICAERLVAADGTVLGSNDLAWDSKSTVARSGLGAANGCGHRAGQSSDLAAGFGAVFVGTHGCSAPRGCSSAVFRANSS